MAIRPARYHPAIDKGGGPPPDDLPEFRPTSHSRSQTPGFHPQLHLYSSHLLDYQLENEKCPNNPITKHTRYPPISLIRSVLLDFLTIALSRPNPFAPPPSPRTPRSSFNPCPAPALTANCSLPAGRLPRSAHLCETSLQALDGPSCWAVDAFMEETQIGRGEG